MNDASMLVGRQLLDIDVYFENSWKANYAPSALDPCEILELLTVVE